MNLLYLISQWVILSLSGFKRMRINENICFQVNKMKLKICEKRAYAEISQILGGREGNLTFVYEKTSFWIKKVCVCWKQTQLCRKGKENRFWHFQCVQWQSGNQETPVGKTEFPSRMRKSTFFLESVFRMKNSLFFKQPLLFFNQDMDQESGKGYLFSKEKLFSCITGLTTLFRGFSFRVN